jgi:hypothetical protein
MHQPEADDVAGIVPGIVVGIVPGIVVGIAL